MQASLQHESIRTRALIITLCRGSRGFNRDALHMPSLRGSALLHRLFRGKCSPAHYWLVRSG